MNADDKKVETKLSELVFIYNAADPITREAMVKVFPILITSIFPKSIEDAEEYMTNKGIGDEEYMNISDINVRSEFQYLLILKSMWNNIDGKFIPNFSDDSVKYSISTYKGSIKLGRGKYTNHALSFRTSEIRDLFYDTFKDKIELCKNYL